MDKEKEILNEEKNINWKFLTVAIVFVLLLIAVAIAVTYAYFHVSTSKSETLSDIEALMECMEFEYGEGEVDLAYNYPITDEFALENIEPLPVMIANYCQDNLSDIKYDLVFTTFTVQGAEEELLSSDEIRMHVKKIENVDLDTGEPYEEQVLHDTNYLNGLPELPVGNSMQYIDIIINQFLGTDDYKQEGIIANHFKIDSDSIGNNKGTLYYIYFWVDYYEGDKTHTGLNDNKTQGKSFLGTVNMAINP